MLKYIGDGSYLAGVPPRDLTEEDLKRLEFTKEQLLATGLWIEEKIAKEPVDDKSLKSKYSNKKKE